MKYCNECGHQLTNAEAVFCPNCGNQVTKNLQTEYAKIKIKKSNLLVVKEFIQANLTICGLLVLGAFILLTFLPKTVGWLYILGSVVGLYIYPVYTGKRDTDLNAKLTTNLANSDVILKKYLEDMKGKRETDKIEQKEREARYQVDKKKSIEIEALKVEEERKKKALETYEVQQAKEVIETKENENPNNPEKIVLEHKKKSTLNLIIYFFGTFPIFIAFLYFIEAQSYFQFGVGLLLISLIVSLISSLIYYLPTLMNRGNAKWAIFFVNLLFGWSIIGWILCLIWSTNDNHKWDIMQVQKTMGTNVYIQK